MQLTARENLEKTIRHDHPQWVPSRYDGTLTMLRSNVIRVRPVKGGKDDWGVNWLYTNEEEGSYPDNKAVIDIEDIDAFEVPQTDWAEVSGDICRQLCEFEGKDILPIAYDELLLFERVQLLLGFEGFMIALVEYRDALDGLIEKIYQYNRRFVQVLLETNIAGIRFTDDWGMQDRLFISPADWRALFKERYRALYGLVKAQGKLVFQHSCGRIEEIMDDIVELGVDVLDPCQPAANDIFAMKRHYGNAITFMGGLDTQTWLTFGTPQEVYDNTLRTLAVMADGGGYIAAPSHTITIPAENRAAMERAIADYNRI